MSKSATLVARIEERHLEILDHLAKDEGRSRAGVIRRLIEEAAVKRQLAVARQPAEAKPHQHKAVRKNSMHLDVCECGAVLSKDFVWRTP